MNSSSARYNAAAASVLLLEPPRLRQFGLHPRFHAKSQWRRHVLPLPELQYSLVAVIPRIQISKSVENPPPLNTAEWVFLSDVYLRRRYPNRLREANDLFVTVPLLVNIHNADAQNYASLALASTGAENANDRNEDLEINIRQNLTVQGL
jgi:hypothetical protein